MFIKKPLPRIFYDAHLNDAKGKCVFCNKQDDLNIKHFTHWTWMYAAFPYQKHHTLLVPKRHITDFPELTPEELMELQQAFEFAQLQYKSHQIVDVLSQFGDQLFIAWRHRASDNVKPQLSHLHVHMYPRFGKNTDNTLDKNAHEFELLFKTH